MTAPSGAESNLARAGAGSPGALRRSSEANRLVRFDWMDGRFACSRQSVSLSLLRADSLAAVVIGSRGPRCPHFWAGVCSAGPWLEGSEPDWPPGASL